MVELQISNLFQRVLLISICPFRDFTFISPPFELMGANGTSVVYHRYHLIQIR